MKIKDFHIVIYSSLESSGGGRETWLNMFVPELYIQTSGKCKIYIYFFSRSDKVELISIYNDSKFEFRKISTPYSSTFFGHIKCLLKFVYVATVCLCQNADTKSVVLSVGSFYDAIPAFLSKTFKFRNKFFSIIWLRTIWEYQIKVLRSRSISKPLLFIENLFLRSCNLIIANGWDTSKYYEKKTGLNVFTIPNAIRADKFNHIKPLPDDRSNKLIISFIGRLGAEKGIVSFLESIKLFNNLFSDYSKLVEFEVVGDGIFKDEVAQLTFPNYTYKGPLPNNLIPDYLNRIHVSVALTSNSSLSGGGSGVSNQLLELIISGRIIIAWDNYTFRQVLDDSQAIFIEEGNIETLAECYRDIIVNYSYYLKKAKNAAVLASRFSPQNHVSDFLKRINFDFD